MTMQKCIFGLTLGLIAAGCVNVPAPVDVYESERPSNARRIQHVQFKQVSLEDFRADTVMVTDIRRSMTSDGHARVQVFVKNLTEQDVRVRCRFDWEDENGVQVKDYNHDTWEKKTVVRGDDNVFTSIAPEPNCKDFKFRIKPVQ